MIACSIRKLLTQVCVSFQREQTIVDTFKQSYNVVVTIFNEEPPTSISMQEPKHSLHDPLHRFSHEGTGTLPVDQTGLSSPLSVPALKK